MTHHASALETTQSSVAPDSARMLHLLRQARQRIETLEAHAASAAQLRTSIAIVGMACRVPAAPNQTVDTLAAFWSNLINGHDAIHPLSTQRAALYPTPPTGNQPGGYLATVDRFDAAFFGIAGREAPTIDPQQRLLLEVAWEALEEAAVVPATLAGSRTGVFIGISSNDYAHLQQAKGVPINAYAGVGNALSIAANRISYLLDLRGPSLAIDTACSSALVALHHACQSLRRGECDGALVGGVNLILTASITDAFQQAGMLAADGRCKTFDARADGYVRSEGAGMVYLKRLPDAQRDGDRLWAVVAGSAVNQDGRSNGLTAPNGLAQQAVIRAALQDAQVSPAAISYVETHGTGTELGDPIEVNALKAVLCTERRDDQPCWLGAVKANIGHLEAAAGIIGLIKSALCLHHGVIPPQLHLETYNPYMALANTPLTIPAEPVPWPAGANLRYAGVSSFGFGGTNAHVVLTEAPVAAPRAVAEPQQEARPVHLFTLAAKSDAALQASAQAYAEYLAANPALPLADLCYTVNTGRTHFDHRLAVVTATVAQLQAQLTHFATGQATADLAVGHLTQQTPPAVAFLFTGQGAQWVGMGQQLYASNARFRTTIEQCDAILRPLIGCSLVDLLYPRTRAADPRHALLHQTRYTQPALFALEYALAQCWRAWGIEPAFVVGHSIGEMTAACIAGACSLEAGLQFAATRGELMQALPPTGAMAAVFCDEATVNGAIHAMGAPIAIAAHNGHAHIVISGEQAEVRALLDTLAASGIDAHLLNVSHAFHSPLMEPMLGALAEAAAQIAFQPLQIPLISTLTGDLLPKGHLIDANYWRQQARRTVRFTAAVDQLLAHGCRHFLEVGPKPVLTNLGNSYVGEIQSTWVSSLTTSQGEWMTLLNSLARLYTQGVPVNWQALYENAHHRRLSLPTYRFQRKQFWLPEESKPMQTNGIQTIDSPIQPVPVTRQPTVTAAPRTTTLPEERVLSELRTMLAGLLQIDADEVSAHTSFLALGADSLMLMDAVRRLDLRFGVKIPLRRFFDDLSTPAALATHIAAQTPHGVHREEQPTDGRQRDAWAQNGWATNANNEGLGNGQHLSTPQLPMVGQDTPTTAQQLLTIINKQLDLLARYDLTLDKAVSAAPLVPQQRTPATPPHTPHTHDNGRHTPSVATMASPQSRTSKSVPLTAAQQQLWFLSQFAEDASVAYNESVTLRLRGVLDVTAMGNAVQMLVERHEALRTIIGREGDVQQIVDLLPTPLTVIDFSTESEATREEAVTRWLATESCRPLDLSTGPLFRTYLLELIPGAEYLLVLTAHHIIIDGLSLVVLLKELADLYSATCRGIAVDCAPAPQFSDYVTWQTAQLHTDAWRTQADYWVQQLQGTLPVLELPMDHPRPPLQSYNGAIATVTVDAELTSALTHFSHQQGCTLFMTLFAAYTLWLHRLTGQEEVIVGVPASGRGMAGAETLVGYCTHLLPIRHTLTEKPSFTSLVQTVRDQLLAAYEHQEYPFAHLINLIAVERDFSLPPIVNTTFNLTRQAEMPTFAGLTATLGPRPTSFVDHDLGLNIIESGGTLTLDFEYNRDLFDAATVARFANHFATLVGAIVTNPLCSVSTLPLLTPREAQQLLIAWNATDCPFNEQQTFHQLFEAQVAKTPNAVALLFADQILTYAELNAIADTMAQQLQATGVTDETVVALLCDRSPAFLAAVIAIFKAGAAYLPLDVRAPAARQTQILAQSRTHFLLITAAFATAAEEALLLLPAGQRPQVINIGETYELESTDHDGWEIPLGTQHPSSTTHRSPLAYLIYTSGSTGLPKGAMVEQRGMINHLYAKIKDLDLTAADTVAQTAPQSFDISVWQFLCPLVVGGRVHIFPDQVASDPVALLSATVTHDITVLEVVPSLLRMMIEELERGLDLASSQLRWMIPTGEALPPNLARQWLRHCPAIPLVNAYGPTECSDDVTHYIVSEPPAADVVNMPIGRPIINTRMYILDEERQPVPIGVAGELYVGGIGVGRGYIYDDARTAQAFVPDPFSANPHARLYKTGDKARYLPDGNIEYLGRLDYQVKIRGFRIELGEIEAVLEAHPAIRQAIVMDQPDPTGNRRLVAYVVPNDQSSTPHSPIADLQSSLRRHTAEKLPDYMVPGTFILLDTMPLTPNGKVDRKALPQPDFADIGGALPHVPPRTDTETALVTIWSEVLKVPPDRIGIHHDFFTLGGHSLLATQAASRIRHAFQVELPLQTYFSEPTIAALAEHIETTQWAMAAETTTTVTPLASNEEEGEL